ncbi:hypothetical protein WJX72_003363 [[Myrmecia] bisecta]|uniref:C2 domain-containing protein n=1 Tax=[Myrmecia] bisecta TaxID=41462 RepID=A0AAW1PJZ5_9CHLO
MQLLTGIPWWWWVLLLAALTLLVADWVLHLSERIASLLVSVLLSSVLQGSGTAIRYSLWNGTLILRKLQLRLDFVDSWDLPFACQSAMVDEVRLLVPWRCWFQGRPVSLRISAVTITACTRKNPQAVSPDTHKKATQETARQLHAAKLSAFEGILWGHKPAWLTGQKIRAFVGRHVLYQIVRRSEVTWRDVGFAITLDKAVDHVLDHHEGPSRSLLEADGIGSALAVKLRSLTVQNRCGQTYGVLATDLQLKGLSVEVGPALPSACATTISVIKRWNVGTQLGWRMASGFLDRVAQRASAAAKAPPVINVEVFAAALLVHLDAPAVKALLGLTANILHFYQYSQYRKLRPQVAVDVAPQLWWQHAGRAVLGERAALLGNEPAKGTTHRHRLRQEYQQLYLHRRSRLRRLRHLLSGEAAQKWRRLKELEARLSDAEIGQFRWWAWAEQYKTRHKVPDLKEMAGRLKAVYGVLEAKGVIRQKRSRPLRAQLSLYCPKLCIVLQGLPDTSSKQGAPALFEVAAQQLRCSVLAGSQQRRQLQSGSGPVLVEASCYAFHVTHSHHQQLGASSSQAASSASAGPSSSAPPADDLDVLSPWLVKSPPFFLQNVHRPLPFLSFSYKQPALKAVEPNVVHLSLAPIDIIYSQISLLQLLAFLNAAWPPAGLDPLTVRASVSLHEIMRERLVGPRRRHQLLKYQETQLQVQVDVGDVRLMLPCGEHSPQDPASLQPANGGSLAMTSAGADDFAASMRSQLDAEAALLPTMFVLVLAGFSARSKQSDLARAALPRAERAASANDATVNVIANGHSASHEAFGKDQPKPPPIVVPRQNGGQPGSPPEDSECETIKASPPHRRVASMSAAELESKLSMNHSSGPQGRRRAVPQPALQARPANGESGSWMRRRAGAMSFERLQVSVGLQAFLAKPVGEGIMDFQDCSAVIQPISIETAVDHCVEPDPRNEYRRVVQVKMVTSAVSVEVSQFAKRELHSLVAYMASSFSDQRLHTLSRHFAAKDKDMAKEHRKSRTKGYSRTMSRRNLMDPSAGGLDTAPSSWHGYPTADVDGATMDQAFSADTIDRADLPNVPAQDGHREDHSYGLVLAMHISVPIVAITLVQSRSAEASDDARNLFRISLTTIDTTLALEDGEQDARFALGGIAVEDLAEEAHTRTIVSATANSVDTRRTSRRCRLQRMFEAWRLTTTERSTKRRRARDSMQHLLNTRQAQLSGHIVLGADEIKATMDGSFFFASLEIGMLRRALQYAGELAQPPPSLARSRTLNSTFRMNSGAVRSNSMAAAAAAAVLASASEQKPPQKTPASQAAAEPRRLSHKGRPQPRRKLCVELYTHCGHIDVIMEQKRFATLLWEGMELSQEGGGPEADRRLLLLQCSGLQIIDRLCASHHYRQAVCCEAYEASESQPVSDESLIRVAILTSRVVHPSPPQASPAAPEEAGGEGVNARGYASDGRAPASRRPAERTPQRKKKAPIKLQTVTRVEVDCLHLTLVCRFVYDILYFINEVKAMAAAVDFGGCEAVAPSAHAVPQTYRPLTEVVLTNLRVDIPRHSWAEDFYSISCGHLRLLLPVAKAYIERVKPNLDESPTKAHQRHASFSVPQLPRDWLDWVTKAMRKQHAEEGGAGPQDPSRFSPHAPESARRRQTSQDSEGNFLEQFHHWQEGADGGMAVQLEAFKLYCADILGSKAELAMRQVWDCADALINVTAGPTRVQIWFPWVSAVFGEAQYSLLMAIIWSNMAEACSFGPKPKLWHPIGKALPPQPPQPERLGVDPEVQPSWEVEVNVRSIGVIVESPPGPDDGVGSGPALAQVQLKNLLVRYGQYPCNSKRIVVASAGLSITDRRFMQPAGVEYDVIVVSPHRLDSVSKHATSPPGSPWGQVRTAVKHQSGPFRPPRTRLARHSSFDWKVMGSPGAQHRRPTLSSEDVGNGAAFTTRHASLEEEAGQEEEEADAANVLEHEGFYLEYVLQASPPSHPGGPPQPGPHVMELELKGAKLQWPYVLQLDLIWDIVQTYTHCICVPWVLPWPQMAGPGNWMYINVILEDSELMLPLPDAGGRSHRREAGGRSALSKGLLLRWHQLRVGYFWGGDGEGMLRVNANEMAAVLQTPETPDPQAFLVPFNAVSEVSWHCSKHADLKASTTLHVKVSNFQAQPSFSCVTMVHTALRLVKASLLLRAKEATRQSEALVAGGWGALEPVVPPFRPRSWRLMMTIESAGVGLVDDRYGHNIMVMAVKLQEVNIHFGQENLLKDTAPATLGQVTMLVEVSFLNSAVDSTEPMVEAWPFNLEYRHTAGSRNITLHSEERLNLIVTPAAFRSVGDVRTFIQMLSATEVADEVSSVPSVLVRSMTQWLATTRGKMSTLYRLVNKSGLRLSYWADLAGQGPGSTHALNPWEESPLLVEPAEKTVILPDSQQQVLARTICMQFEGNWTPVTDIVVDKVGKYAYIIGSPHDVAATPVVMDVTLDVRTKVLTVHSPFRIENHTTHPLEFTVHLFRAPNMRNAVGRGAAAISTVPGSGPLSPGLQCYLPVPAIWGGLIYLHAVGYQMGKKDKIDIVGPQLKEKQGLYTCPAMHANQKPFHCCLEVREDVIKVCMKEGEVLKEQPEYVLRFQPPLVIHNVLPYEISITLFDSTNQADPPTFTVGVGGSVEVYQFDMTKKIRMAIQMQEYKSTGKGVAIHHPPSPYFEDSARRLVLADLPGLRMARDIVLVKDMRNADNTLPRAFGYNSSRLVLRLHNKMNSASRAREVVIFCPFWVINKTNLTIRFRDNTPSGNLPVVAPPGLGGTAQPLLFSSTRGSMKMCVHPGHWSRSINLDSLGINGSTYVLGPTNPSGRREMLTEDVVRFEVQQTIAPRGMSPRGRNNSRLHSRLSPLRRNKDEIGTEHEEVAPPVPSEADPGHLLAKFNCGAGGSMTGVLEQQRLKRYEFSVETGLGPTIFHRSKVITITSRYVLFNNSDEPLQYGQRGTKLVWQLPPDARAPFHWDDAEGRFELCVRPSVGQWNWSGAFQIDGAGDFGLRVYSSSLKKHRIIPVDVSLNGASYLVTVGKEAVHPPYRIENRCEHVKIRFQQRDVDGEDWEVIEGGATCDYAWEEPLVAHRLRVMLDTDGALYRDSAVHEYNLDVIKAHPVVKLRRTNFKMVQKMANMGRALTASVVKSGPSLPGQHTDQPELDARYVYVGVHADGPTRVLCFSETRDQYTHGSSEESVALLTKKLKRLEERIKDVNEQLREFDEKQNIDMSLVMGQASGDNAGTVPDQASILHRGTMRMGHTRSLSVGTDLDNPETIGSPMTGPRLSRLTLGRTPRPSDEPKDSSPWAADSASPRRSDQLRDMLKAKVNKLRRVRIFQPGRTDTPDDSPLPQPDSAEPSTTTQGQPSRHASASQPTSRHESQTSGGVSEMHSVSQFGDVQAAREDSYGASSIGARSLGPSSPATREASMTDSGIPQAIPEMEPTLEGRAMSFLSATTASGGSKDSRTGSFIVTPRAQSDRAPRRRGMKDVAPIPRRSNDFRRPNMHTPEVISESGAAVPETPLTGGMAKERLNNEHLAADLAGNDSQSEIVPAPKLTPSALKHHAQRPEGFGESGTPGPERTHTHAAGLDGIRIRRASVRAIANRHRKASSMGSAADFEEQRSQLDRSSRLERVNEHGDPILGGELVVKVISAMGLMESWMHREKRKLKLGVAGATQSLAGLQARLRSGRTELYCVLQCQNQVKRTQLASGASHPVWKEEVTFKAVQITSDLQVSVYGRSRIGQDVFLGEVVIPLREVEELAAERAVDVRRYTLGRRNTKEKVSGEINLVCSWRVTPLDVVTMKVRAKQEEVDHKEEILALLMERYSPPGEDGLAAAADMKQSRVKRAVSDVKRMAAYRGRLDVKVLEARNLAIPSDLLHTFYTMDSYAVVSVSSEAGVTSHQTKVDRNNLQPHWNEHVTFGDVALSNSITVTLFDHKKLTSDVFLGQVGVAVMRFRDCKPHYMWLPLQKRNERDAVAGELHLRVQWSSDEVDHTADASAAMALEVMLRGIGVSIVEASVMKLPKEVMHALFEDIHVDYKYSSADQSARFAIYSVQLDNQLLSSSHPVVLADTPTAGSTPVAHALEEFSGQPHHLHHGKPFVEVRWEMLHHNPSILYFKNFTISLQEMDLVIEEDFLDMVILLIRDLPMADIYQTEARDSHNLLHEDHGEALHELLDASMVQYAKAHQPRRGRKWYFEMLDIQSIRCNLTLIPRPGLREPEAATGRIRMAAAMGIQFIDINNVPLKINVLQLKNEFVSPRTLMGTIVRHLKFQALSEMHKILGQVDILGTPIALGSSIMSGLTAFFVEPAKARTPKQFAKGLGHGSMVLLRNTTFGIFNMIGQVSGGLSKGMAVLTMDQEYINRFRVRPSSYQQRLVQGLQAVGVGFYEGIVGVVREPVVGWQEHKMLGLLAGLVLGLMGLVLKPTSGLFEFASKTVSGVGSGIQAWGEEVVRPPRTRIRSPRHFGMFASDPTGEVRNFSRWKNTVSRLEAGRYAGDNVLDYLQNKDNKVLIFTDRHLIYVNLKRQRVRWAFSLEHLSSFSTHGLVVLLHQALTLRLHMGAMSQILRVPARKRVECRTRDLHQSLLVKLNRAMSLQAAADDDEMTPLSHRLQHHASLVQGDLHIMHQQPPPALRITTSSELPTSHTRKLSQMLPESLQRMSRRFTRMARSPRSTGEPADGARNGGPPAAASSSYRQAPSLQTHSLPAARLLRPSSSNRSRITNDEDGSETGSQAASVAGHLQAVQLLCQAAEGENVAAEAALQHMQSIGLLCRTCLRGMPPNTPAAAALQSLSALSSSAGLAGLQQPATKKALLRSLHVLAASAEEALLQSYS